MWSKDAKLAVEYKLLQQVPGRELSFHGATKQNLADLFDLQKNGQQSILPLSPRLKNFYGFINALTMRS